MPRCPKGEKRAVDAIGNAVTIAKIATGEIEDITTDDGKNAAAVALGRMGGKARAEGMTVGHMPATSGLPLRTDIDRPARLVRLVPRADTQRIYRLASAVAAVMYFE
jgi:hypothetical protein